MGIEKPLKKSGVSRIPRQFQSDTDLLDAKGLAYEGLAAFTSEKIGHFIFDTIPDRSWSFDYLTTGPNNGELNFAEVFEGATQTTPNRRARVDITYTTGDPTSEVWEIYDPADGTTVLRTITLTHTWSGGDLVSTVEATT